MVTINNLNFVTITDKFPGTIIIRNIFRIIFKSPHNEKGKISNRKGNQRWKSQLFPGRKMNKFSTRNTQKRILLFSLKIMIITFKYTRDEEKEDIL